MGPLHQALGFLGAEPAASVLAAGESNLGLAAAGVLVFGVTAQWIANRLHLPSILLLLIAGILAGPVIGLVDPDELLGDLLFPAVSIAVGILLFEGGLSLRFHELERQGRGPIVRLITVGVLVTWAVGAVAAHYIVGLDWGPATLVGAILTVSGPTVVLPLLSFARIREPVNGILRWEGIFIDPVGATLAIVVLNGIIDDSGTGSGLSRILTTTAAGVTAGAIGAAVLMLLFAKHWVPDQLHNPFTLMVVVAAFAAADLMRSEAGLFATTIMGVILANQTRAPVAHIREFEENLGAIILAILFVILGARVDLDALVEYAPQALLLTLVLIVVARPLSVLVSTLGSGLASRERAYLVFMAPRGIVAAAVSALFAIELEEVGRPVEALVPVVFIVITGTVTFYSVMARVAARRLRVARPEPTGVAFIGGPDWAIELASVLAKEDVPVLVVTNVDREWRAASERGILTYTEGLDNERFLQAMNSLGVRAAIATSRFQEQNAFGLVRTAEDLGRANVYFLRPGSQDDDEGEQGEPVAEASVIGRQPFGKEFSQDQMQEAFADGARFVAVDADSYDEERFARATPMIDIGENGVPIVDAGMNPGNRPAPGVRRVYLVPAGDLAVPSEAASTVEAR